MEDTPTARPRWHEDTGDVDADGAHQHPGCGLVAAAEPPRPRRGTVRVPTPPPPLGCVVWGITRMSYTEAHENDCTAHGNGAAPRRRRAASAAAPPSASRGSCGSDEAHI
jgi:hypothetical protein